MTKSTLQNVALATISVCLTLLGLELALRIRAVLLPPPAPNVGRMKYDPRLGWVPRPGRFGVAWTSNVDSAGFRRTGSSIAAGRRPILAVGDSFTFGDEVEDGDTWPTHLERLLGRRVLNAGVGAYGIDQAFLRAEPLIDEYDPEIVILSFIADDINRTEFSYYPWARGQKPYFAYDDGSLVLRNVPVPRGAPRGVGGAWAVRRVLGHSRLASAVLVRIAPRWWQERPGSRRVHDEGESVSVDLLVRLDSLTRDRGSRFVAVALATNASDEDTTRLPHVVKRLRENGIEVLDLSTSLAGLRPDQIRDLFSEWGHYTPAMNRSVTERLAAFLR